MLHMWKTLQVTGDTPMRYSIAYTKLKKLLRSLKKYSIVITIKVNFL